MQLNLTDVRSSLPLRSIPTHSLFFPWPYRDPQKTVFPRKLHGDILTMGSVPPDGSDTQAPGILYGHIGRLAIAWLVTLAKVRRSREIELPPLNASLRELGLNPAGGAKSSSKRLAEQIHRITSMYLQLTTTKPVTGPQGTGRLTYNQRLFICSLDARVTWGSGSTKQGQTSLFSFSKEFYEYLEGNTIPVPTDVFQALGALHQDLLTFLSLVSRDAPHAERVGYSIAALSDQFGFSKQNRSRFREELISFSEKMIELYDNRFQLRVDKHEFSFQADQALVETKKPLYLPNGYPHKG